MFSGKPASETTSSSSRILRVAALVAILVVAGVVAVASQNANKSSAETSNLKKVMLAKQNPLKMYQDESERVQSQDVSPILDYVPRDMARAALTVMGDFPPGYTHVMTCGHDQAGKLFWNELNGGLAGLHNVAKTKAVVLRFWNAINGKWVESTVIVGGAVKSVSDNLKTNTVLNGNVPSHHRGSAWRDFNFHASDAATMGVLGFSCDPYTYSKGTFAAGSVYFACGNGGGLHINKVGPTAPWNGVCTFNTPNVRRNTHVLLYYKTVLC